MCEAMGELAGTFLERLLGLTDSPLRCPPLFPPPTDYIIYGQSIHLSCAQIVGALFY